MAYKILFGKDRLLELLEWFEVRRDRMPKSVRIDQATFVPDIMLTVERFQWTVKLYHEKPCYSGEFELIMRMKDAIIREHPELEYNDEEAENI